MHSEPLTNKFVAVLNKKIEVGAALNGLGHMAAGLVGGYPNKEELRFDDYYDKDGNVHPSISDHPFIVLRADNSNQLRTLRQNLLATDIHFVDFTSTMTVGTYIDQQERTKNTPEIELEYYGICMFGSIEKINELTRKFSLWR